MVTAVADHIKEYRDEALAALRRLVALADDARHAAAVVADVGAEGLEDAQAVEHQQADGGAQAGGVGGGPGQQAAQPSGRGEWPRRSCGDDSATLP
jgi:hypothetical protein